MPNPISHIILELAREPGHPHGDRSHAYHLYVPLDEAGRIDAEGWRRERALCRVRRFRPGEAEARGQIVHGPGGRWTFDYMEETSRDDEVGFRFGDERFVVGEYVSIREDDGDVHTFQVVQVKPV
ncbi:hypothetical protein [Devosia sp.]|uniref:hypothetical protein n=1 Tax=Devosia sp. TaxID=1871048 RepID=UPI002F214055